MAETARTTAVQTIGKLLGGATLDATLPRLQEGIRDERERGLAAELSYGVARWYFQLNAILDDLSDRPTKDKLVQATLLTGLYQLRFTRVPPHAAISESVNTVRKVGRPRAAAMVNAVLRRYQRESERCEQEVLDNAAKRHAYPQWLVDRLSSDWPEASEELLKAGNERPPMWLRINQRRAELADWCAGYAAEFGVQPLLSEHAGQAVRLPDPISVQRLPGFATGEVSVQDAGAQLAAPLLELRSGMRVLDACAAPGGKTCHILESADVQLTAVDNDARRLRLVQENLQRLGLQADVVNGDVGEPGSWWDGRPFDRILLDVPCSATGVIRRHPDIKLMRRDGDIAGFAARQRAMLATAWPLLAPGGRLLYVTCSVLAAENAAVIESFLASETRARSRAVALSCGQSAGPGMQILTGEAGMDGFYYSCLAAI